jgi:hypothetical protein
VPGEQPPYLSATEARREAEVLTERIAGEPDARVRRELGRRLAFVATSIAVRGAREDPALVEVGIAALHTARRCGGATDGLGRVQARLVRAKLALGGGREPHVPAQRRARIVVESGCVCCCADPGLAPGAWRGPAAAVLDAVNRGSFFLVGVGGDGAARGRAHPGGARRGEDRGVRPGGSP